MFAMSHAATALVIKRREAAARGEGDRDVTALAAVAMRRVGAEQGPRKLPS